MTTPTPPTDERLAEIRKRADAATPGPWSGSPAGWVDRIPHGSISRTPLPRLEDVDFIAHSREDVPHLLSEIDRLRIKLTDQEHAMIALRAERDTAVRVAVGLEHDYAAANAEREEMRERGDRIYDAFVKHRTATHEVKPISCMTCREADAALDAYRASGQKG